MTLDVVESHLRWCHAEVVWPKKQDRHLQPFIQWDRLLRPMEDCVVHHEHSSKAPVGILLVKMTYKLHDEEAEGVAVGIAAVDAEQEFTASGQTSNDVDASHSHRARHLIQLTSPHPTSASMVGEVDDRLINVDDCHARMKRLDILGRGKLPLQLAPHLVVDLHDGLDLPISRIGNDAKILPEIRSANFQTAVSR